MEMGEGPPSPVLSHHFMLFANNPSTGESAMMSFGGARQQFIWRPAYRDWNVDVRDKYV
jgi:hypothetical protein